MLDYARVRQILGQVRQLPNACQESCQVLLFSPPGVLPLSPRITPGRPKKVELLGKINLKKVFDLTSPFCSLLEVFASQNELRTRQNPSTKRFRNVFENKPDFCSLFDRFVEAWALENVPPA